MTDFEAVDVSSQLPSLIRRPGLTAWRPSVDKEVSTKFETYADFVKEKGENWVSLNSKMTAGHWPPANVEDLGLERWWVTYFIIVLMTSINLGSLRIYPHLQDTGGFFVAVLQKKRSAITDDSNAT
jgi:multisite-specific tRNA:(cytosine-C5)-methyltransferase